MSLRKCEKSDGAENTKHRMVSIARCIGQLFYRVYDFELHHVFLARTEQTRHIRLPTGEAATVFAHECAVDI